MQGEQSRVAEIVDSLHAHLESMKASADVAIVSLISAAGEIALSLVVAKPELKDVYLKTFNTSVEQVKNQLRHELKSRGI